MDKGHKGQMSDKGVMRLALEALVDFGSHIENCPQFPTWAEPKKHPSCTCGYDTAIATLRQALEQPDDAAWARHLKEPMSEKSVHESDTIVPSDYSGKAGDYTEQESVYAFRRKGLDDFCTCDKHRYDELASKPNLFEVAVFYTAPPKREWVGLTDKEIQQVVYDLGTIGDLSHDEFDIARAVAQALKERNT